MKSIEAFKPYTGSSTHGFGKIRKKIPSDMNIHSFVFECEAGEIFFDYLTDNQIKGIKLISTPTHLNLLTLE